MNHISVVIPSYNTADTLGATLDALDSQITTKSVEVIVVDCSDDDSVEHLVEGRKGTSVLRKAERFNPGEGRNIGAQRASGQLLAFVDADVVLGSDALEKAFDHYAAGNRMFGGALELQEEGATISSYLEHYFFNHEAQSGRPSCTRSNLSSALMLVERDLFLDEGGFRDVPRMQDTELSERLREKRGIELTFAPSVVGYQVQDSSLSKVLRKVFLNGRNVYFIRYAHRGQLVRIVFLLLLPAIGFAKTARIIGRHLLYQNARKRLVTILLAPLLGIAGLFWTFGFYDAIIFQKGISADR